MESKIIIGQYIKSLRQEKKISQEKLAGLADIDRTYMQSIERGDRNISIDMLIKIATAMEMKASEILKGTDL